MQHILTKTPPRDSKIEIKSELNQTIISWKNPQGHWTKYLALVFLLAWMGGWAVGEYSVAKKVLSGQVNPFEIFWLIGWSVGGIFAAINIYLMIRPAKAEKLILDGFTLQFRRGTPPFAGVSFGGKKDDKNEAPFYQKIKSKYSIPKKEIGEIKLERIGESQRLTIDYGVERIEVGKFLQEIEREWIFEVLKQWKGVV